MTPFRLQLVPFVEFDDSEIRRNIEHAAGFPRAMRGAHVHPVAVCGGGPSLESHLEELRAWPGDIWAINFTADWLLDRGIDCTLFTIDSGVYHTTAAKRLIATNCARSLFTGDVRCFGLVEHEEGGVPGGTTSACRAAALAIRLGYPGVVYFGCDSSFEDKTHADRDQPLERALIVRANGRDWKTFPQFCMQAECLSELLRDFPQYATSKSGGLLDAMAADPQWSVVAVSDALKRHLIEVNGDAGLYDEAYRAPCHECGQTVGHYDDCPVGLGVL